MKLFPLFANLSQRRVLVVGGGDIAERKIRLLLSAGACVRVLAPAFSDSVLRMQGCSGIELQQAEFAPHWLDDVWFVVAATNDKAVNRDIAAHAEQRRLLVNVVDDAELSSCHVPAIVDRSPVTIAISSAGSAPMIARWIRERIEAMFGDTVGKLAALAHRHRAGIRAARPSLAARRDFYQWLIDGPVASALYRQQPEQAESLLRQALDAGQVRRQGCVMLVETGIGQPDLLSLQALRALNRADLILHDAQVPASILGLARRDAACIPLGGNADDDGGRTRLRALLLSYALQGESVVLLKAGCAFTLGVACEDVAFLAENNIPYQIVPCVPPMQAASAYAGVPLMHPDHARSVQLVSPQAYLKGSAVEWSCLTVDRKTLVQEIQPADLAGYCAGLIAHGCADDTPCALVADCAQPMQQTLVSNLRGIAALAHKKRLVTPVLLVVGPAAGFARALHWFGEAPVAPRAIESPALLA